jgi:hypothetical protein
LHPDRLLELIKTVKYPLDEGILICEKNNQFEGKAILEEKAGNIRGALHSRYQAIRGILKSKNEKLSRLKSKLANHV